MHPRAEELIARLSLEPHPEGGFYRRIFRSEMDVRPTDGRGTRSALTTIFFVLTEGTTSRWHRVMSNEAWHLYEGGPVELLEIDASMTTMSRHLLAAIGEADGQPVHIVAGGHWQAARSLGDYAFMGCTVGPGFDFADFKLMANDESAQAIVRERWPEMASLI
jgi:predicted cupin superfamily sugar epimerase